MNNVIVERPINEQAMVIREFENFIWKLVHDFSTTAAISPEDLFQEGIVILLSFYASNKLLFTSDRTSFHYMFRARLKNKLADIARMERHRQSESFEYRNEEISGSTEDPNVKETFQLCPTDNLNLTSEKCISVDSRIFKSLCHTGNRWATFENSIDMNLAVDNSRNTMSVLAYRILKILTAGCGDIETAWDEWLKSKTYIRIPKQYTPEFLMNYFNVSYSELERATQEVREATASGRCTLVI